MRKDIEDIYPLSPLQRGMLFHALYAPEGGMYIEQSRYTIQGPFDTLAFERAWQQVVEQHPMLRTAFIWDEVEQPLQLVLRRVDLPFEWHDWRGQAPDAQQDRLQAYMAMIRQQGYDLSQAPLMRLVLVQVAEDTYEFIWSVHHIILDGWSVTLLFKDLLACYAAHCRGERLHLQRSRPYRDYIAWLQQQDVSRAEAFWRQTLQGCTVPTPLGIDRQPGSVASLTTEYGTEHLYLPPAVAAALQAFTRQHHLTLNTVLQGVWALLLSRYSGQDDVLFGAVVSGRPATLAGADAMVGLFINTLPVRVSVTPEATLLPWLHELQARQVQARQYEYSPLVEVQGWSDVPRGMPLFESLLVFENLAGGSATPQQEAGLRIRNAVYHASRTGYPLTIVVEPRADLVVSVYYDDRRFDASAIRRLLGHMQVLLESLLANPGQRVVELPLLTAAERHTLLTAWNATCTAYPRAQCVHELFAAQVAQRPDAVAVVYEDQQLTYAALDRRANQLAHHLQGLGVGPEVLVGVCLERSLEMVVGLLGILQAGGAYVPLDPTYPEARLAFMVEDTQASVLLTQERLQGALPTPGVQVVCIDADWEVIADQPQTSPVSAITAQGLAYVMYTSGSTGTPKGICISHQAINRLVCHTNYVQLGADDRIAQASNASFDAATFEIWGALLHGARLVGITRDVALSPHAAAAQLREQGISVLFLTTALFNQLVRAVPWVFQTVRYLLFGGEAVDPHWVNAALTHGPPQRLLHVYGPTESTTFTSWHLVREVPEGARTVPIGRPLANTQIYLLDRHLQAIPVGVAGELYIGGDGLARGYLHRPELTAERFLPHPCSTAPGARLYKTGDLARYLPDGAIEFLGRIDHQVKLRGFRIELAEIEAALSQHAAVQDVVVTAREDAPGERRLVAYVVPEEGAAPSIEGLRTFLQQKLPEYMVPAAFVSLAAMPLTPNGKVDRAALPAPERTRPALEGTFVGPRTPVEEVLAGVWARVLDVDQVGIYDNFFALGGHSLLAMQVLSRLREVFQVEVPLRYLFEAPTVAGLAEHIATALRAERGPLPPPVASVARDGVLPVSFAQQRLWVLDQIEPGNPAYNMASAVRLTGALHVAALERSLNTIVQRHESLRTTFAAVDGRPLQSIAPALTLTLPVVDLSAYPEAERQTQAQQLAAAEALRPFHLASGPLFRTCVLRLDEQEHIILCTMHHIVSDEWSLGVLVREVAALYDAFCQGQPAPLPALPIQYVDFAHWQRQWFQGQALETQLSYWRQRLGGTLPVLQLPFDRPRPARPTYRGALHTFVLPSEVSAALITLSREEGVTVFMTLLGALQVLLQRYAGQDDVVVGTDVANRTRLETEGLIGFFVNHLVLRTDLSGNPTFRQVLQRVREVTLGAYMHQELPFDMLVGALRPERQLHHTPLFQVLFVFGNPTLPRLELSGLRLQPMRSDLVLAKYDLTLFMGARETGLGGAWRYSTDVFDPATITRLSDCFMTLLGSIVAQPESRLHRLEMLPQGERQQRARAQSGRQEARRQALRSVSRQAVDLTSATATWRDTEA